MRIAVLALACLACGCSCAEGPRGRDGGRPDATAIDATSIDALELPDAPGDDARELADAPSDAPPALDAPPDAPPDAPSADAGCVPGTTRACTITCTGGTTAAGRELCLGGDTWGACERRPEICGNSLDDDGDGEVDEECVVEGPCVWIRPQCQSLMTMNAWCASAGGRHLVAGRRCPVAGGAVVPLDATYGEYPLCCCDVASMCVPECTDPSCSSCVVWDEIQCCM